MHEVCTSQRQQLLSTHSTQGSRTLSVKYGKCTGQHASLVGCKRESASTWREARARVAPSAYATLIEDEVEDAVVDVDENGQAESSAGRAGGCAQTGLELRSGSSMGQLGLGAVRSLWTLGRAPSLPIWFARRCKDTMRSSQLSHMSNFQQSVRQYAGSWTRGSRVKFQDPALV